MTLLAVSLLAACQSAPDMEHPSQAVFELEREYATFSLSKPSSYSSVWLTIAKRDDGYITTETSVASQHARLDGLTRTAAWAECRIRFELEYAILAR